MSDQTDLDSLLDQFRASIALSDFGAASLLLVQCEALLAKLNSHRLRAEDEGSMLERIASFQALRDSYRAARMDAVQPFDSGIAVSSADFRDNDRY